MFKPFQWPNKMKNNSESEEIYLVTTTLHVMPEDIQDKLVELAQKEGLEAEVGPFGSVLFFASESGVEKLAASYKKWLVSSKKYFAILIYNEEGCYDIINPEM